MISPHAAQRRTAFALGLFLGLTPFCVAEDAPQNSSALSILTDSQEHWLEHTTEKTNLDIQNGLATPTAESATLKSKLFSYEEKQKAQSLEISQSPIWQNWQPVKNLGPANLNDAPIFLSLGKGNYWMFGRYHPRRGAQAQRKFRAKEAQLDGFDIPLETTRWNNQFNAVGAGQKTSSGYHAWQSRDMKNWVHFGPVSDKQSAWMTNAEYVDGKAYFYYDFPNDQDPHLIIDDEIRDGKPGKFMGMVFKDPSHGSDAGIIRDLEGKFHLILENWDPINASTRSWDSPLASHAVSPDGISDFKLVGPAVDERTKPTGKTGFYNHPHWAKEDPENYKNGRAEYEIHEPEQHAYGDWAAISIGGQYYLFGDYDPAGAHGREAMSVCWFTSESIDKKFTFCDHIGQGHPDPDICFAEGQFYLATQMKTDYVSPGPWVESVEVRVGVDTDKDQTIDHWSDWQTVKESYDHIEGFAKQIAKTPAQLDLSDLPAGYGFQYEIKLTDTTENKSKPILDKVTLALAESAKSATDLQGNTEAAPKQSDSAPYDGSWESLQKMPVPAWFDDGKIGIFIHWGPYSAIGYRRGGRGYAEHVPKLIYRDPRHYYPYLKKRWGAAPPAFGYKDIIAEFKAENWDPEQWARLFREVGARYVVFTAEHHDGWANWDSDLTPWNAVNKGPKRDLVGDLGKALRKEGLKYAPSYHRERHSGFFAEEQYVVHSEPRSDIAEEVKRVPEAAMLYGPFSYSKAFVDDYVARWKEIEKKYHPDMLWMDDFPIYTRDGNKVRKGRAKPEIQYFDDQLRAMITDFMNQGAARGQAVYVNNKGGSRNWPDGVGCLEKDNLSLKVIGPKWQSCTTFGTSFGYLEGDKYKSIEEVIHEMIEVISRNGNFLINIGPKADGTIPEPQVERLRAMGTWLAINGDAIYGSRYWKVCEQQNEHLAFTTRGKKLYAIKLARPTEPFTIEGTAGWEAGKIQSVKLLGCDADIPWQMTPSGLRITPLADLGQSSHAWSFEIVTDEEQHAPNVMVEDADAALKNTRKVDLEGRTGNN